MIVFLLAYAVFVCRNTLYITARRIRSLDDDAIRAMLEQEDESDKEIGGEESDDEERAVNESDHSSDSEIDGDQLEDSDRSNHSESSDEDNENYYLCKDKVTKWYKNPCVSKFAKTPSRNLLKFYPSPRNNASHIEDELQAFLLLITNEMIEEIVGCTNMYITAVQSNYDRERDAKITTKTELKAFLGLLVLSGAKRAGHVSFLELWATDGSGIEIFRACMSYNRFLFLLSAIRFDDRTTRSQRKETDKLAAIRYILDEFVQNCKNIYCLSEFLTIDETLVPFRGRCSFIQYIPSKPAKYGIKIFALCDTKTYFTGNLEVYCGKQPTGPHEVSNSPADIVERLISHLKGACRNLTTDNWYTSYTLAMSLLQGKITMVGTLKITKEKFQLNFCQTNKSRSRHQCLDFKSMLLWFPLHQKRTNQLLCFPLCTVMLKLMPKPKSQRSFSSIILRKEGWIQLTNSAAIILCQGEPVGGLYVSFSIL